MTRLRLCLALLILFLSPPVLVAQSTASVERYGVVELELESATEYVHPILDVELDVLFIGPDGRQRRMGGFWDGGSRYLVRFAPDLVGRWRWESVCSDTTNDRLHEQSGTFDVVEYTGDDPYRARGWPRAVPGSHHLVYADSTPYFYLGCTAWEMSWRSYSHETDRYFSDRRSKGYNAVQMVVMSHRQIQEFGVVNRNGDSSFIGWDQSMLNPAYFRYLDSLIGKANDSGLAVTVVPLWGDLAWIQEGSAGHRFPFNRRDALSLGRYVAARFGAYNVIWIIAGDARYHRSDQKEFWNDFGRLIDTVSGGGHLMTVHSAGWSASWHFFPSDSTPWLDFHTYHSSHLADNDFQWLPAAEAWRLEPVKPFVNGEQVYEDIYNNFHPDSARIDRRYVRQAAWESFLSGALVGVVYGANSIWQWHNGTYAFEAHAPRVGVLEALDFPGSNDAAMVRNIAERFRWWEFVPRPDVVLEKQEGVYIPCAVVDSLALLYFFRQVGPVTLDLSFLGDTLEVAWIDPVTGVEHPSLSYEGEQRYALRMEAPDTNDWLLVVRGKAEQDLPPDDDEEEPVRIVAKIDARVAVRPRRVVLDVATPSAGEMTVRYVDMLGRTVRTVSLGVDPGEHAIALPVIEPGVYVISATLRSGGEDIVTGNYKLALP